MDELYKTLGIDPKSVEGKTSAEAAKIINKHFRQRLRELHPDHGHEASTENSLRLTALVEARKYLLKYTLNPDMPRDFHTRPNGTYERPSWQFVDHTAPYYKWKPEPKSEVALATVRVKLQDGSEIVLNPNNQEGWGRLLRLTEKNLIALDDTNLLNIIKGCYPGEEENWGRQSLFCLIDIDPKLIYDNPLLLQALVEQIDPNIYGGNMLVMDMEMNGVLDREPGIVQHFLDLIEEIPDVVVDRAYDYFGGSSRRLLLDVQQRAGHRQKDPDEQTTDTHGPITLASSVLSELR